MFHCVNPIRKKNVKPNKRAVSTKSTQITVNLIASNVTCFKLYELFLSS